MNDQPRQDSSPPVVKATRPRIRHTMLRVSNLEESIRFYTEVMGMEVIRRRDNEGGKYTIAFVGYGGEEDGAVIELTYNWGRDEGYDLGTGFGHIAIGVPDIYGLCEKAEKMGYEVPRPAGPLKHGGPDAPIIAFLKDPDGYMIELGERA